MLDDYKENYDAVEKLTKLEELSTAIKELLNMDQEEFQAWYFNHAVDLEDLGSMVKSICSIPFANSKSNIYMNYGSVLDNLQQRLNLAADELEKIKKLYEAKNGCTLPEFVDDQEEEFEVEQHVPAQPDFKFFNWQKLNDHYYSCLGPKGPLLIKAEKNDEGELKVTLQHWEQGAWHGMWFTSAYTAEQSKTMSDEDKVKKKEETVKNFQRQAGIMFGNPNA